jgi:hypothetical protein
MCFCDVGSRVFFFCFGGDAMENEQFARNCVEVSTTRLKSNIEFSLNIQNFPIFLRKNIFTKAHKMRVHARFQLKNSAQSGVENRKTWMYMYLSKQPEVEFYRLFCCAASAARFVQWNTKVALNQFGSVFTASKIEKEALFSSGWPPAPSHLSQQP